MSCHLILAIYIYLNPSKIKTECKALEAYQLYRRLDQAIVTEGGQLVGHAAMAMRCDDLIYRKQTKIVVNSQVFVIKCLTLNVERQALDNEHLTVDRSTFNVQPLQK